MSENFSLDSSECTEEVLDPRRHQWFSRDGTIKTITVNL